MTEFGQVNMWDTVGQEKFRSLSETFYKRADGVIIAYCINDRDSFDNMKIWLDQIEKFAPEDVKKILIATKSDLESEREVSTEEGQKLALAGGMEFFEVSSKSDLNVQECVDNLLQKIRTNPGY